MARTIETPGPQGATLTCKLFAIGSDTATETITLTEATNRKGIFTGTIASATGWHRVVMLNGASNVGDFVVNALATDGVTYTAVLDTAIDWAKIQNPTSTVALSGTTVKTATDVETDTADIQNRLPAALAGGFMKSDVLAINGSTMAAIITAAINGSLKTGTVDDATFSPTSTVFETDITTNSDEFTKQTILWTGGLNAGMFVRVLSYAFANSKVKLTLSEALPNVPVDGDTFAVTSRIE